jgi:O-antigen ligase
MMPLRQRLVALAGVPFALVATFMTAHGLISTLASYFGYGTEDASIAHRVSNYDYVEQLVRGSPWIGHGGGTYIPSGVHILDNQYLKTAIELGGIGVLALVALFLIPMIAAIAARRRSTDEAHRLLCAALAGGVLAALVCSSTFDSLSFPMFFDTYALMIGLIGACWRLSAPGRYTAGPAEPVSFRRMLAARGSDLIRRGPAAS